MEQIKIKVLEGVDIPIYDKIEAGFELKINSFKKVFKGHKQIEDSKLVLSKEKGYITLRPFERALLGTGIFLDIPVGYELQIRTVPQLALTQGLTVLNSPGIYDSTYKSEINVLVYNASQFLSRMAFNQVIAYGVLSAVQKAKFTQVNDL